MWEPEDDDYKIFIKLFTEYPWKPKGGPPLQTVPWSGVLRYPYQQLPFIGSQSRFRVSTPLTLSILLQSFFLLPNKRKHAASHKVSCQPAVATGAASHRTSSNHIALVPRSSFWPNKFRTFRFWVLGRFWQKEIDAGRKNGLGNCGKILKKGPVFLGFRDVMWYDVRHGIYKVSINKAPHITLWI